MTNDSRRRAFCAFCVLLSLTCTAGAHADSSASRYAQARRTLQSDPLPASQFQSAQAVPASYLGRTLEVSARIGGFVTADGVRTVLLSIGTTSVAARLPSALPESGFLASGQTVRVLLHIEKTGNDLSLSNLTVIAVAPEAEVAALERARPVRAVYTSRSLSYTDQRRGIARMPVSASPGAPSMLSPRAQAIYAPYWSAVRGLNPRLSSADVDKITTSILYYSDANDIDPRLIMAMIICESGFDIHSTSRTGAMGLGQLMPATARGLGVTDAYDPVQNIAASVRLLRGHLDQYGGAPAHAGTISFNQIALTMAAYNAGPGAVRKYHGVPPYRETQHYVAKVAALYKKMCGQGS